MRRLIASDMDGTIVPEGTFDINPEYFDVIRKLHDQGDVFVAASGRHFTSLRKLLAPVEDCVIFLCGNGTYVSCRGVAMDVVMLPDDLVLDIVPDMERNGSFVCADTAEALWTDSKDKAFFQRMMGGYRMDLRHVDDLMGSLKARIPEAEGDRADIPDHRSEMPVGGVHDPDGKKAGAQHRLGVLKVALHVDGDASPIAAHFREKYGKRANIMAAGKSWVDAVPLGADKGIALSKIQRQLGFSAESTVAFGDNGNDIGMLECAGESYCVQGGREETKQAARYVIGEQKDDAVLEVLKKFVR